MRSPLFRILAIMLICVFDLPAVLGDDLSTVEFLRGG